MKLEISLQIFEKVSSIEFQQNLSSRVRVVPCGQTDGQMGMTKLILTFRDFADAPKNCKQNTLAGTDKTALVWETQTTCFN